MSEKSFEFLPEFSQAIEELSSVGDWIRWGATEFSRAGLFFGHGTDNPWDEAALLVLWGLGVPWDQLEAVRGNRLTGRESRRVAELLQRRIEERVPAAYLTGEAWFAGLRFEVNEQVLVPRSPIAELIRQGFEPWLRHMPARVLDLCTGSGCIGIACAYAFPEAQVVLSDVSEEALMVARRNIEHHQLAGRVKAVCSDAFDDLAGQFDLIVSNPPYVDAEDMASLPAEFRAEPELALASGDDGLDFTRRLLQGAALHLAPDGLLVVEVGNSAPALEDAFPRVPFIWLEFEHGGHGVFALSAADLRQAMASDAAERT